MAAARRLYVNGVTHPLPYRLVQCLVHDLRCLCTGRINVVSIGDQKDVIINLGSSAACTLSVMTDGRTGQAVVSPRSVATGMGICWCERLRLSVLPSLLRGFRSRLRSPLRLSRMQISSARAMPFRFGGSGSCVPKNQCLHLKKVKTAELQRSVESLTVFLSKKHSPWASHLPFLCRPCRDVPVVALKVFLHALHLERRGSRPMQCETASGALQCGHCRFSSTLVSITAK